MIGTALFMGCYQLVLMALPFDLYRATAAWVISYLLSIGTVRTHSGLMTAVHLPTGMHSTLTLTHTHTHTLHLAQAVWQHALHRHLVFGTGGDYWASLLRTYIAYTLSIALSSAFTFVLDLAGVHPQLAFALATGATGLFNYLTLRDVFKAPAKPNVS